MIIIHYKMEYDSDTIKKFTVEMLLCSRYDWKAHKFGDYRDCKICLENMLGKYMFELPCGHKFDYDCIMLTLIQCGRKKCPECNKSYTKTPICKPMPMIWYF